ncbi:hypothetical protein GIB67_001560 [Kingdonia uniflora]|uniref:Pectinesterase n=1 Tax=Kingdonia uniflora TaxID=39325 RepID=A0A7J7L0K9_9MAGN|nr:hypothetical protein GIB67_001560 [Kingdonia uniflora]
MASSSKRNLIVSLFILLVVLSLSATLIQQQYPTTTTLTTTTTTMRRNGRHLSETTTMVVSNTCSKTEFPTRCVNSLLKHISESKSDSVLVKISEFDLVHISVNMTVQSVSRAFYSISTISNLEMDTRVRSAYDSCIELIDDSLDQLSRSLVSVSSNGGGSSSTRDDVLTWLSAALTNHDTCTEGFEPVNGFVKDHVVDQLSELSELVSNCLALFAVSPGKDKDFAGIPIQDRRRKLLNSNFPAWVKSRERKLLDTPVSALKADIVVSKNGNGTYKTIGEAIHAAPEYSNRRIIIYIKTGRYEEEILKVGRKKKYLMFVGDGKGKTVISGGKSVYNNLTTFRTASFAATGEGFMARDITFENWAGPEKHQAVALRLGADHSVIYRCNIIGYQDTLYVHSQRMFFRECDVWGTVDFIFGNAAVVFQNCSLYGRKPLFNQKITFTAQNRKDKLQNSGISIHQCRILPAQDLEPVKYSVMSFLGRPWKLYSRVVVMQSYIGDFIQPRGWLEWNYTFALDTLYYGEYLNYGPGAALGKRVNWPGYHVIKSTGEAKQFTVQEFILGSSWLPSTGVTYLAGLSV